MSYNTSMDLINVNLLHFFAIDLFYGDIFVSFEGHEIHEVLEKRSLTPKITK